jgi:hypothetical protein
MDHSKITNPPLDPDDDPEETAHVCPGCGGDSPVLDQCCSERCEHLRRIRTGYTADQCRAALTEIEWQEDVLTEACGVGSPAHIRGPAEYLLAEMSERREALRARLAVRVAIETLKRISFAEIGIAKIKEAIEIAVRYGGVGGDHHKAWVIDQMVRTLAGSGYDKVVSEAKDGEDGPDTYTWDVGVPP